MQFKFIDRWNNITYLWSNGYLETLPDTFRDKISSKKVSRKVFIILREFITDFLKLFIFKRIPQGKVWFFALTKNNYDALREVKKNVPNSIFVSYFRFRSRIPYKPTFYFTLPLKFFEDLLYPVRLAFYWFFHKRKAIHFYDLLLSANGSYEQCLRLLKRSKPKAVIFSNDHLVIARAMLLAANDLGIKTYYIQHASVSEFFPPLEFSHSMLEGKDSIIKYESCGKVKSMVHMVGMSKFDDYHDKVNSKNKIERIGIAFNFTDSIDKVYNSVLFLKEENPDIDIFVRPHPGDKRDFSIFFKKGIQWSDSKKETAFQFLHKIDCLISGDSSIHLEAVLLNVYPCYYNFNPSLRFDYYGYVKNNLVEYFENFEALNTKIKELQLVKPNIQKRASYYNSAIGTNFYGNSTSKISSIILNTLDSEDV